MVSHLRVNVLKSMKTVYVTQNNQPNKSLSLQKVILDGGCPLTHHCLEPWEHCMVSVWVQFFIKGWQEFIAPYPAEDPVSLRLFLAAARSSMEGHLVEFFKWTLLQLLLILHEFRQRNTSILRTFIWILHS